MSPADSSIDSGASQEFAPLVATPYSFAERGDTSGSRKVPFSTRTTCSGLMNPWPWKFSVRPSRVFSRRVTAGCSFHPSSTIFSSTVCFVRSDFSPNPPQESMSTISPRATGAR